MNLTGKQKNYLRGVAHSMNPIVMIGAKGLTDAVLKEVEIALDQHELIKIKLPGNSKAEKTALLTQITESTGSEACLLYTSPSPRDLSTSRMPSSA